MMAQTVYLLDAIQLLTEYLSRILCRRVFQKVKTTERRRRWTLYHLAWFWVAVAVKAPPGLTAVLGMIQRQKVKLYPRVKATPVAFFKRCQKFRWIFFAELYRGLLAEMLPIAPTVYAKAIEGIRARFGDIWVIDGSRLDKVMRRLKILWKRRSVILPGCLTAYYDVSRGIIRELSFFADAAKAEMVRALETVACVPAGTLLMGDRLYGVPRFFAELGDRGIFGLFRRNKVVKLKQVLVLSRWIGSRCLLEDILVEAGGQQGTPKVTLRWIRYRHGSLRLDLVTNILDQKQLSAKEAVELYRWRWSVERLFFDLKEVLHLNRLYASSPNAVAMQVYGAAMVHLAFRIAQGRIAKEHNVEPEQISPKKLFGWLAEASVNYVMVEMSFDLAEALNPGVTLKRPTRRHRVAGYQTTLEQILVRPRIGRGRKRRFCAERRRWKSFKHIPGGRKFCEVPTP